MLANVMAIAAIFAVLMAAQFTQTVAYVQSANSRNAARVADIEMNAVEANFIEQANAGTSSIGATSQTFCLNRDGTPTSPAQTACTYNATATVSAAGNSTSGLNPACTSGGATPPPSGCVQEVSDNVNQSIDETRSAYVMNVTITTPSGSVAATKQRTITIRSIPNAATNGQYVTVVNTADDASELGGGRNGTATTEGDASGCDPTISACGDRTTIRSWSTCSSDTAMAGGALNAAQSAWCAANAKNTAFNGHIQAVPQATYEPTTTLVNKPWTNTSGR